MKAKSLLLVFLLPIMSGPTLLAESAVLSQYASSSELIMIPMRDGDSLAADIYFPLIGQSPWPTVLVRTPYGRSISGSGEDIVVQILTNVLAGYVLVVQDTRGRGDSQGTDSLYFSDGWGKRQDGYDTVEWIAEQSWSNGKIGMWGPSALGITQYLAAGAKPPHLTCCCVLVATGNLYEDAIFYDGVYRQALVDGWLHSVKQDSMQSYFVDHPNYEPIYDTMNIYTRLDSINVPILHIGGWHDIFLQGNIDAFTELQENGGPGARGNQKLILGPWVHNITAAQPGEIYFPHATPLLFFATMFDWFDYWLKDEVNTIDSMATVQYYVMGDADQPETIGNNWIESETWPPEYTPVRFYLQPDSGLASTSIPIEVLPDTFSYDPQYPVLTRGGRNMNIDAGTYDQRELEARPDVLTYTTEILMDTVIIAGPVWVQLYAGSDALDTDFMASLCDVYPDGRSMLIADGAIQARHRNSIEEEDLLTPGEIESYTIDLWSTAVAFAPGHRIRLNISSSNYNRFAINPNTGEPFRQHTRTQIALQSIYHDLEYPSTLILPVMEGVDTAVPEKRENQPETMALLPNFPNPFNGWTSIPVILPNREAPATLSIFDLNGRLVKEWTINPSRGLMQIIKWNGRSEAGSEVTSGVYITKLQAKEIQQSRKIMLLK
ncbi:CocE/NonD family hydrolase [candidate division KSB1 bacterium]|nr:CocE/NonD family hydrolase [candidate division KSB1 bacterium]